MINAEIVSGFLFTNESDPVRNQTVCQIEARAEIDDFFGMEPWFRVRFADGHRQDVIAQALTPWYAV